MDKGKTDQSRSRNNRKSMNIRIDGGLHRRLKIMAAKKGVSMNDMLISAIEKMVEKVREHDDAD